MCGSVAQDAPQLSSSNRQRLDTPYFVSIVANTAVARKWPHPRDVQNRLARPIARPQIKRVHLALRRDVRLVVGEQQIAIPIAQQRVENGSEAMRVVGREVAFTDLIEHLLQ